MGLNAKFVEEELRTTVNSEKHLKQEHTRYIAAIIELFR